MGKTIVIASIIAIILTFFVTGKATALAQAFDAGVSSIGTSVASPSGTAIDGAFASVYSDIEGGVQG